MVIGPLLDGDGLDGHLRSILPGVGDRDETAFPRRNIDVTRRPGRYRVHSDCRIPTGCLPIADDLPAFRVAGDILVGRVQEIACRDEVDGIRIISRFIRVDLYPIIARPLQQDIDVAVPQHAGHAFADCVTRVLFPGLRAHDLVLAKGFTMRDRQDDRLVLRA